VTIGPHGKTVEDCALLMRAMLNRKYYEDLPLEVKDPFFQALPFNEEQYKATKKLRIGYYKSIAYVPAADCMQRGVEIARAEL
jgi:Asp-tRNA(Asn)/Glu-tRNA(Gln) amidotransferase A subunit family amidase